MKTEKINAHPLALGLAKMNGTGGAIVAYLTGGRWSYSACADELLLIRPISREFVTEREIATLPCPLPPMSWL